MPRVGLILGCSLIIAFALPANAAMRKFNDLSAQQVAALQNSEQRLIAYDHALQSLEDRHLRRKVDARAYETRKDELLALICDEAQFQNAVLTKDTNKEEATTEEILSDIVRYSEVASFYALQVAGGLFNGR
jgi:hypothetical protein